MKINMSEEMICSDWLIDIRRSFILVKIYEPGCRATILGSRSILKGFLNLNFGYL